MFNLVYNSNSLFDSFILSQRQSSWKCSSQKYEYNLLADGTILKRLPREVVVRERRKLKKYRKLIDEKRLSLDVVFNAYKSWRGTYKKFNSHNTIRQMDKLFNSLFGGIYERRKKTRNFDKNQLS